MDINSTKYTFHYKYVRLQETDFIVNYITFGPDISYPNLQRSFPHNYIQLYIP